MTQSKTSTCATMRKLALLLLPFTPVALPQPGLFKEHILLFRLLFPWFQKYITKGYVSKDEARKRLAQVVGEPSLIKSGIYWSWNKDSASFKNQLLEEASDVQKACKTWEISEKLIGHSTDTFE
ncbi:hypothetical protein LWI28_014508 [Acer negundo]|uniref:Uncharacterized protein n=1 Tax=Acer negundo TaxID=4023 RepID=A0AAD5NXD4_ACENE|nr:hypothetical protein LWI28_014508 [Acer negundo]